MAPRLPLDIIERVIDEVSTSGDKNDLIACSLTGKDFLDQSRRYLFRSITFNELEVPLERYRRLLEVFRSSPEIAGWIQEVNFIIPTRTVRLDTHNDPMFSYMLRMLGNIKIFRLCLGEEFSWGNLAPIVTQAIIELMLAPAFTHLRFDNIIDIPVAVLNLLTKVPVLFLQRVRFAEDGKQAIYNEDLVKFMIRHGSKSLEELSLGEICPKESQSLFIKGITPSICQLKKFEMVYRFNESVVQDILQMHSDTMISLDIPIIRNVGGRESVPDIAALTKLQIIRFTVYIIDRFCQNIVDILAKASEDNQLSQIIIHLRYSRDTPTKEVFHPLAWDPIDSLLSELRFAKLERL